jgi:hypothetical protein
MTSKQVDSPLGHKLGSYSPCNVGNLAALSPSLTVAFDAAAAVVAMPGPGGYVQVAFVCEHTGGAHQPYPRRTVIHAAREREQ